MYDLDNWNPREISETLVEQNSQLVGRLNAMANDLHKLSLMLQNGELSFTDEPKFLASGLPSMNEIWHNQLDVHAEWLLEDGRSFDEIRHILNNID